MEDKLLIKKNIKANLPYGGMALIVENLKSKGITVSKALVSNVCNPSHKAWNNNIIGEAQAIIIKEQESVLRAKERVV